MSQAWQRKASSAAQNHLALMRRQLSQALAVLAPNALEAFISLNITGTVVFGVCKIELPIMVIIGYTIVGYCLLITRDHRNIEGGVHIYIHIFRY